MLTIIGNHVSPYVRKVLAALELKGVPYRVDPIVPFFGDERFAELSPLRRVPVLIDGDLVLPNSTVICEYLDEAYPGVPLLPAAPRDRARARWIEEFADSRLGDVLVWRLFFGTLVGPRVLGRAKDEAALARVVAEDVPAALARPRLCCPPAACCSATRRPPPISRWRRCCRCRRSCANRSMPSGSRAVRRSSRR